MSDKIKLADLIPYDKNAKKHPPEQIQKIKRSIERHGFRGGLKFTADKIIVVGHGRVIALMELGITEVDKSKYEILEKMSPEDIIAYRIADNRTAESDWDFGLLKADMTSLKDADYDLAETGFDDDEIDDIFDLEIEVKNTNKEVSFTAMETEHKCPKCGFKF